MINFMKRVFVVICMVIMALAIMRAPACAQTQAFENKNISITSILAPQYLGWAVSVGSTTQNITWYYKVSAVVPEYGETVASAVTTAYSTYSPLSSTNSLRLMWAPVDAASSYYLYRSADNVTFYKLTTVTAPVLTFVDDGTLNLGAAYSAPSQITGNLSVSGDVVVGAVSYLGSATAIRGTITPRAAGGKILDATSNVVCESTGTSKYSWVLETSTVTICPH